MKRFSKFLCGLAVFSALSVGASVCAEDGGSAHFTTEQRAEIVSILRQALKDDPTILTEALRSLREQMAQQQQNTVRDAVRQHWASLKDAPDYTVRGNSQGSVTVVEFLDPRCSYCRAMIPGVERFLARHKDVRLVERLVPVLGKGSVLDTQAIQAASLQGKYAVLRQALMNDTAAPSVERVRQIAQANGIDADRLVKDMNSPAVITTIRSNLDLAQAIGLDGTPTFVFGTAVIAPGALNDMQMDTDLEQARRG
ncbi:DsbA family protein [Neokomagataea thailandica]|uniref:DsbA family protein n=1 Tax=Neokomagataea TaxID=1223423 RepID=UPI000A5DED7C|nr:MULTISPECIES: DsbA family protein [Neokomagataea]